MRPTTHDKELCRGDIELPAGKDEVTAKAQMQIAGMLAIAYRRLKTIRQVRSEQEHNRGENELANLARTSVHGVVE